ncbi:MAG: Gfo/Idh/MocA family protein [Isosphaeraceae bacterium]
MTEPRPETNASTRREFLKATSVAAAGTTAFQQMPNAFAAAGSPIKVGQIGSGGRGSGAAENILTAAGTTFDVKIHAMADAFEDRLKNCFDRVQKLEQAKEKFDVTPERCFVGFDAYKQVVDCCDLVMLATPPGFRPQHLEYAINAGKHVFCEKPVAVDGTGIRKVLAAAEVARSKNLAIVAGTQRRHQAGYVESMKRIKEGEIGEILAARVFWNQGNIWAVPRKDEWKDMEYQMRNWYHFLWLCGGCIVEQHVHNLDVACWALGGHPVRCVGMGGREVNTGPEYGESFDHFSVDYEFPNDVHVMSNARQISGCEGDVSEYLVGTKGRAHLAPGNYRFAGPGLSRLRVRGEVNPYVQEHINMLESITAGKPINELTQVAESTLAAIMGRMSAYTGKAVTWDQALNSQLDTFPETLGWDVSLPGPTLPKPGSTPLV